LQLLSLDGAPGTQLVEPAVQVELRMHAPVPHV
jgi:hypothetical protein